MSNPTAFFEFMQKRERLRLTKAECGPWPWSADEILNTYKFTNVKREQDRTTQWMREHWTEPNDSRDPGEIIFNCGLFRYFGTIEFAEAVGWQSTWEPSRISTIARQRMAARQRVFTGAYIIPTLGVRGPKSDAVCNLVLSRLWQAKEELACTARITKSWRQVGERLMRLPGFGGSGFMAKEVLQDALHTSVLRDACDRNTWCPIGPGARRGLNRVYGRRVNETVSFPQGLSEMIQLHVQSKRSLPSWMPDLELHDIQFQLCEFDKYERARLGEGRPKAKYRYPTASKA